MCRPTSQSRSLTSRVSPGSRLPQPKKRIPFWPVRYFLQAASSASAAAGDRSLSVKKTLCASSMGSLHPADRDRRALQVADGRERLRLLFYDFPREVAGGDVGVGGAEVHELRRPVVGEGVEVQVEQPVEVPEPDVPQPDQPRPRAALEAVLLHAAQCQPQADAL